jgi:hypothetical protein
MLGHTEAGYFIKNSQGLTDQVRMALISNRFLVFSNYCFTLAQYQSEQSSDAGTQSDS